MSIKDLAAEVASRGRHGDTDILHVNPVEIEMLQRAGVPLTTNPDTGKKEAFLPLLMGVGGSFLGPTLGIGSAMAGAIGSGLGSFIETGNPLQAVGSGLLGYGASQLTGGIDGLFGGGSGGDALSQAAQASGGELAPSALKAGSGQYGSVGTPQPFWQSGAQPTIMGTGVPNAGAAPSAALPSVSSMMPSPAAGGAMSAAPRMLDTQRVSPGKGSLSDRMGDAALPLAGGAGLMAMSGGFGGRASGRPGMRGEGEEGERGELFDAERDYTHSPFDQRGRENDYFSDMRYTPRFATGGEVRWGPGSENNDWNRTPRWTGQGEGLYEKQTQRFNQQRNTEINNMLNQFSQGSLGGGNNTAPSPTPSGPSLNPNPDIPNVFGGAMGGGIGAGTGGNFPAITQPQRVGFAESPNQINQMLQTRMAERPITFQRGGQVGGIASLGGQGGDPKKLIFDAIRAIQGEHPSPQVALAAFVKRFGKGALMALVERTRAGQGPQQGRMVDGPGDGLSDSVPASIEGQQPALLSDGEYVVPADVVSDLGNGSSDAGADRLEGMSENVRRSRNGRAEEPPPVRMEDVLPNASNNRPT